MAYIMTWEFWSVVIFFLPLLMVGTVAGRIAFKKGHREAYYLLGFCLLLCAAVYANKVLHLRLTGPVGLERDKEVLEAKTETIQARDDVKQMKLEVERAQVSVTKVERDLQEITETMYVADNIILHGMRYPVPDVFLAAAYREMRKLEEKLGTSRQTLKERTERIVQQTEVEHRKFWAEYEKLPDEKAKQKSIDDLIRRARE